MAHGNMGSTDRHGGLGSSTRALCALAIALLLAACGGNGGSDASQSAKLAPAPVTACDDYLARLAATDHASPDFAELMDDTDRAQRCLIEPKAAQIAASRETKSARPVAGFVNFETPHVHPIDLTPDGSKVLVVNTANNSLEVFAVSGDSLVPRATIAVGLDPVSVRVRGNDQAWVVNHLSDSISVVDLTRNVVSATIDTDNEPADVVFAGAPAKAFVSCSEPNRVLVYDLANLAAAPRRIALQAEDPRAMAVSPDGMRVYVAAFESGNGTTALNGRLGPISTGAELGSNNVVSLPGGPYAGVNPPPNSGSTFSPARNPTLARQVSSMIVRKDASGRWMDDNGRNWSAYVTGASALQTRRVVGWDLPDRDVAIIDAQSLSVGYQTRLMNMVMGIGVNPATGEVTVVGTDATNELRFEPNVNATFVRVNRATFSPGAVATVTDLNPHLTYTVRTLPPEQRTQSIGDPRAIAWNAAGTRAYVAGMGSNNLIAIGAAGQRLATIPVGKGPTGVVIDDARGRAYVSNKFDATVSVVDLVSNTQLAAVSYFDPTPAVIKAGRPFLYDTHFSSGLGQASCGSCHVDARTDRLAWDLGDPAGSLSGVHHPMKGPMMTQSLQDIMRFPNLHWRGDRANLAAFNGAYVSLMGRESQITIEQMQAFGDFLATIHFPPSPYRNLDNSLPRSLQLPTGATADAVAGRTQLAGCLNCHLAGRPRTAATNAELSQNVIPPTFAGFYDRFGYQHNSTTASTSGFGYFHDGVDPLLAAARGNNLLAAIMTYDGPDNGLTVAESRQDTHAAVGKQVTVSGVPGAAQAARLAQLTDMANTNDHVSLIVTSTLDGVKRAWYDIGGGRFQSPATGQQVSRAELDAIAANQAPVTYTQVVRGTERALASGLDTAPAVNQPPSIASPGSASGTVGVAVSAQLGATDPEGDAIVFSANGLPSGLSISAGGLITGTPTTAGAFPVVARAIDARGAAASVEFNWTIVEPAAATGILAPSPGALLTGGNVVFAWNIPGATAHTLRIGTWLGGGDLLSRDVGSASSFAMQGLPLDGRTIYLRLSSLVGGVWRATDALYATRAPWGDGSIAQLLSPVPGGQLAGASATLSWSNVGASQYWVFVGTGIGWSNLYNRTLGTATSTTVTGLPLDGSPVYVRLWSQSGGAWNSRDFQLRAAQP